MIKNPHKMGLETLSFSARQLWNLGPVEIKQSPSLLTFKERKKDMAS